MNLVLQELSSFKKKQYPILFAKMITGNFWMGKSSIILYNGKQPDDPSKFTYNIADFVRHENFTFSY